MGCLVIRGSDLHESTHKVCRVHGTVDRELHNLVTTQLSKCMHQGGFATACRTNLVKDKETNWHCVSVTPPPSSLNHIR